MKAQKLIQALKKKFGVTKDIELQKALGLSPMTLNNWRAKLLTPRIIAQQIYKQTKGNVSGDFVVRELHQRLGTKTLKDLSSHFDVTLQTVRNWKNLQSFTPKNTAKIVEYALKSSEKTAQKNSIRPLVEFFPITKCRSKQGKKFELFSINDDKGIKHTFRDGLRKELNSHHGLYIFFDSRGEAIYTGKARKQDLWKEMTNAFNRDRDIQKIWRVQHPSKKEKYRTSDEKARRVIKYEVPLYELATYFSAYHVADGMVNRLEALLVRSFANNLLNKRMETFGNNGIK